jgi:hypothetical protein
MSATYVKESYRSSYTLGVADVRDGRATIIALYTGVPDTRDGHKAIAATAYAKYTGSHPDDATMPLRTITVRPLAGEAFGACEVVLNYWRTLNDSTGIDPKTMPRLRSGIVSEQHWQYMGTDPSDAQVGTAYWRSYHVDKPVMSMYVDTSLTYSPISTVFSKLQTINGDTVTFSGKTFTAATIRFDAVAQQGRVVNGTAEFYPSYVFVLKPDGFIRYSPGTSGTAEGTALAYGTAVFGGSSFPYT